MLGILGYGIWILIYIAALFIARAINGLERKYHIKNEALWFGSWIIVFLAYAILSLFGVFGRGMSWTMLLTFYVLIIDWAERIMDLKSATQRIILWLLILLTCVVYLAPIIALTAYAGITPLLFLLLNFGVMYIVLRSTKEKVDDLFSRRW